MGAVPKESLLARDIHGNGKRTESKHERVARASHVRDSKQMVVRPAFPLLYGGCPYQEQGCGPTAQIESVTDT